ncbi:MAG: molybdopterin molybdotransferase MoeA [Conexivisphaerales archaeon]
MQRISYADIETIIKREFSQYPAEVVDLVDAIGRIASEDVISPSELPPFDVSEKDGYAVNHKSILHAKKISPVTLKVSQSVKPGSKPHRLQPGTCARIYTGAWVPEGADSVVMQEDAIETAEGIVFVSPIKPGSNIFRKGTDIKRGTRLMTKGDIFRPYEFNLLSSLGVTKVKVSPRLKVAILSTGSELVTLTERNVNGKIPDTNKPVLMHILDETGFQPIDAGIAPDDLDVISNQIKKFAETCNAVIVTGGSSVGGFDLTEASLEKLNAKMLFHGVKMRPSSTAGVASLYGKPVFLLSGLIQSSVVAMFLIVIPALRYIQGLYFRSLNNVEARMTRSLTVDLPHDFVRSIWVTVKARQGILEAEPILASSHARNVLVRSNGIMLIEGGKNLQKGELVKINIINKLA